MKYSIAIAVHNNYPVTLKCLQLVFSYSPVDEECEVLVVDNGSTDQTREYLAELAQRGHIRLFRFETNEGFIVAQRQALAMALGDYFVMLNNDVEVVHNWLEALEEPFKDPQGGRVAITGVKEFCTVLRPDGTGEKGEQVDYVEGSCLMIPRELAQQYGLFSDEYRFAYYEDSDLCLRMKQRGFRVVAVSLPGIQHLGAVTARVVQRTVDLEGFRIRNQHIFLNRWGSLLRDGPNPSRKILVRRGGARGDVILITPILQALRKLNPKDKIFVATGCPEVLQNNPHVTRVVGQDTKALLADPDMTLIDLDMAYESRPNVPIIDAYAEVAGVVVCAAQPQLYPSETDRLLAYQRVAPGRTFAVIHPGLIPGWVGRQVPIGRFVPVVEHLKRRGLEVVLVGDGSTPDIGQDIDLRNIPFQQLVSVMERAVVFVGLDSMPLHVAQARNIRVVGLFGSIDPALRLIRPDRSIGITAKNVGCLGCHHYLPAPRTCTSSCLRGQELCMDRITSQQIIDAIEQLVPRGKECEATEPLARPV